MERKVGFSRQAGSAFRIAAATLAMLASTALRANESSMTLRLTSPAFAEGASIPSKYTCEGQNVSPPLAWSGVPEKTKGLVLIIDDPDAPDPKAPRMTWVHWVLYDLPPSASALAEGAGSGGLPAGTKVGLNDWKKTQYGGPCPPIGRHRYIHKLYALDIKLSELKNPTKADVERAMKGHILAETRLIGTYQKIG
jgi:Raf kinase inhibitor-like YbhB/YbcL family protein